MTGNGRGKAAILAVLIAVSTWSLFRPILSHDFVNYDDTAYISENPRLVDPGLSPAGVRWAFSTLQNNNWHPLTWISHMVDVRLFGLAPYGHHLVNLLLHVANALLLLVFFRFGTGSLWRGGGVVILFAIHPLHVESVAWAAERKDLLCAFFFLLAANLYLRYAHSANRWWLLAVATAYAGSLLSKPMAVTFPLVLLLIDLWPLGRVTAADRGSRMRQVRLLVVEKLPFFLAAAALSALTIRAQSDAIAPFKSETLPVYAGNAVISYVRYLGKTLWPEQLTVFYPFAAASVTPARVIAAAAALLAISLLFLKWRDRYPFLAWGWGWYVVTLLPVIGFVQVGEQAIADRYTYLPLIGVFVAAIFGISTAVVRYRVRRSVVAAVAAGVFTILGAVTANQLGHWRTSQALFSRCLEVSGDSWLAHNNLGVALFDQGKYGESIAHYRRAIELRPTSVATFNNLGNAYSQLGRRPQAIAAYDRALELDPGNAEAHFNRGLTYHYLGDDTRAMLDYVRLRSINSAYAKKLLPLISE